MPNAEKVEKVALLKERIQGSGALLLAEYRGLSVHDATELRRSLSGQAKLAIAKNTLLLRAAGEAGIEGFEELLVGPTAVAFVEGDVVAAAKKLVEAAKRFPALVLKGGYMDGRVLGPEEAKALADLESREVMLSRIAGMLQSEMSRAASMFQALQSQFVGLMEALKDKLPGEEAPAEAEPEPEADTEPEPETEPEADTEAETEPEAQTETEAETEGETEGETEASQDETDTEPETSRDETDTEGEE